MNRSNLRWVIALTAVIVVAGAVALRWPAEQAENSSLQAIYPAARGPLSISLSEAGTIQSREKTIVRCAVEGRNTLIWLIDEGRSVNTGDLLAELDSSKLTQERLEQQLRMQNAEAALEQARENLEIVRSENESNIETAQLNLRFARRALEKYEDGEYPGQLRQAEADIAIASEEWKRATDRLSWSDRLAASGHITRIEFEADELVVKRKALDDELARGRLHLLTNYTKPQQLEKLNSDVKQAEGAYDRARRRASASLTRGQTDLRVRQTDYEKQRDRLAQVEILLANCRIVAPTNGLVIFASSVKGAGRRVVEPLQTGQDVVERQELIYLPATSEMLAEIKIPESSVSRITTGLQARIQVDALPGQSFKGYLGRVGLLPDAEDAWLNPNLKLFNCEIYLMDGSDALRPGMSCRVELMLHEFEDVVYVPLQTVMQVGGTPTVYVAGELGEAIPRAVSVGPDNNRMIVVTAGLEGGEPVLLNPPLPPSSLDRTGDEEGAASTNRDDTL